MLLDNSSKSSIFSNDLFNNCLRKCSSLYCFNNFKNKWRKTGEETGFGPYMNQKYFLKDIELIKELDTNMALLRLLKDHVQEQDTL